MSAETVQDSRLCDVPNKAGIIHKCYPDTPTLSALGLDRLCHPDEVGEGSGAHLSHRRTSVNLYGDLAYPQIGRCLLVHLAGGYQQHDLLLTGRESCEALLQLRNVAIHGASLPIP